jgi:hypothetical protein
VNGQQQWASSRRPEVEPQTRPVFWVPPRLEVALWVALVSVMGAAVFGVWVGWQVLVVLSQLPPGVLAR